MKKNILFLILGVQFSLNAISQNTPPSASAILKEASAKALKEKKNVFVIFHASWCGWCKRMDTSMNDAAVKSFFDKNYVITHLVVYESNGKEHLENPGALDLLTKYGGNDQGIPYWFVFDAKGNLLADSQIKPKENSGCPATKKEVDYFIEVLKKTSTISQQQIAAVEKTFRKNEQ